MYTHFKKIFLVLDIQQKLRWIIMSISISMIVFFAVIMLLGSTANERQRLIEDTTVVAKMISSNNTAAVLYDDPEAATEALETLKNAKTVAAACIFDAQGKRFASYAANEKEEKNCLEMNSEVSVYQFFYNKLIVRQPLLVNGRNIGTLFIHSDLSNIQRLFYQHATFISLLAIVAALFTYFLANRLQYIISHPIRRLTEVARTFAKTQDIENEGQQFLKAEKLGNDEVGILVDSFNNMIERIQVREGDLKLAKEVAVNERFKADKATKEAILANRMKSEFLANMSHELRTPLNSLLILSEYFKDNREGNLSPRQVEDARIIFSSGTDLLTLINDILDLSKVEAGKMNLNISTVSLDELARCIHSNFEHVAEEQGLGFDVDISMDVPRSIMSDRIRIEQIIRNLVSNAMKFTHEGFVKFAIKRADPTMGFRRENLTSENAIAFSITDSGIGIPPEKKEAIFEAFQQADGSTSRKYGGTGLGLSISRELSLLLGGEIYVTSAEGKGATFTFYLPENYDFESDSNVKVTQAANGKTDISTVSIKRQSYDQAVSQRFIKDDSGRLDETSPVILIVEDDQNFAKILYNEIHGRGLNCIAVNTAEEGIEELKRTPVDVLILDIELPGMNGLELFDLVRLDKEIADTPVYFMSVHDESVRVTQRGAIGYLTKPVTQEQLVEALDNIENIAFDPVKKLLVVEDDIKLRDALEKVVEQREIEFRGVGTAELALKALSTENFDCMILDIGLPGISGLDLLDEVADDHEIVQPPVIVYTGKDLSETEKQRLFKYTDSFIQKNGEAKDEAFEKMFDKVLKRVPRARSKAYLLHDQVENRNEIEKGKAVRGEKTQLKTDEAIALIKGQDEGYSSFEGKKILLVDDDIRNIYALSRSLDDYGVEVLIAANGKQALELLHEEDDIDLILMDIMMPVMDGYEAIERIRKQAEFEQLPIIAVTAKAMAEDKEKCLNIGANDYLSKPINRECLFDMIKLWLNKSMSDQ